MAFETADLEQALRTKGFVKKTKKKDHAYYYFQHEGHTYKTIWTKISYGSGYKTYSDDLERKVRSQLRLNSTDFRDFIKCPFTHEDFVKLLKRLKLL